MTIKAEIICDSVNDLGNRLTTYVLYYPRFIHSELMTHRVFSRNSSSSRAIPIEKMINSIMEDTAYPIHWGKNKKGMQADEECDSPIYTKFNDFDMIDRRYDPLDKKTIWNIARDNAIAIARGYAEAGYHKQIVNRLLEPFMHMRVILSGTEFDNFFKLRNHPDAQPEIRELARQMQVLYWNNNPKFIDWNEWHLPFITKNEEHLTLIDKIYLSVARCASVSYKTVDGFDMTLEKATEIYDKLTNSNPIHASPFEHVATPSEQFNRNFCGWTQYRTIFEEFLDKDWL